MMTKTASPGPKWSEIGRSTSSDKKNLTRAEVNVDDYYVVIGFEVNKPDAFKDKTQDLAKDYGHAFFYVVKNKVITKLFSFGPDGPGKVGFFNSGQPWGLKNGYNNARPGDADYAITETVKAFRIKLTVKQGRDLEAATEKARKDIKTGKQKYTAYMNDTCAETARDVLSKAGVETPSGAGKVKHSDFLSFPIVYAVNPYKWHDNFRSKGYKEITYKPPSTGDWHPPVGDGDPIFGKIP